MDTPYNFFSFFFLLDTAIALPACFGTVKALDCLISGTILSFGDWISKQSASFGIVIFDAFIEALDLLTNLFFFFFCKLVGI